MSLMLQKLNNIRSLRAMSREFSIDVLEEMLEKLRVVTEEKRSEQHSTLQQQAEYQETSQSYFLYHLQRLPPSFIYFFSL